MLGSFSEDNTTKEQIKNIILGFQTETRRRKLMFAVPQNSATDRLF